jgi:hypothetical protein
MRLRSTWLILVVALATGPLGRAADMELTHESPFLPAATSAAAPAESATLQLAGISVIEPKIYVLLVDTVNAGKSRSRWIAVGAKVDDLEVLSCDMDKDEAVVRVGSDLKTLALRKPASAKSGALPAAFAGQSPPMPLVGPAGGALPQVAPLVTREEKEREARMLVSDLLDISMRQRKAYEEAQRAAAAAEAAKKGGPSPGAAKAGN